MTDGADHAAFRSDVRRRLDALAPEAPSAASLDVPSHRRWQRALADAGLVGVTWPEEHGGAGLGPVHQLIVDEELTRAGLPGIFDFVGVALIGPTIIACATEEQRHRYLAPILRAEEVWCQLFSEPAAGSDLAAVQTRARLGEDGWRISGQKVWTSNAHNAAFGMLLARTDPHVPKHRGLTMFVVPMDADGITVRGLRQISGESHFNEVFLDDVVVPEDATIGPIGEGWATAMTTLGFERLAAGLETDVLGTDPERFARAVAGRPEARHDAAIRERLGRVCAELLALQSSIHRQLGELAKGGMPGPEGALTKITAVNAATEGCDLALDVLGPDAFMDPSWHGQATLMPAVRSAGGTEEILRNMVGERVLGLAPEPRTDKGVSFAELQARRKAGVP